MTTNIIGIDLGTTHSCVAIYSKERVEVFENDHGLRTTPSYVAFTETESIVGNEAKLHTCVDPSNTVFDAKRMIGRSFDDPYIQRDMKHWPFKLLNNAEKPRIKVEYKNAVHEFVPEQISAMILMKLKEIAEDKTGSDVSHAVITVPAYFNDSQRQATKDAARIAGLNVLKLINEPTAAALAFTFNKREKFTSNILVFDLGGGTFDVSVLSINNGVINVKAVNGDTHLGGSDFDVRLVEHFVDEIKTKYNRDLRQEKYKTSRSKLRCECETVKKSLSGRLEARIKIASLFDNSDFVSSITRAKFEQLCEDLFRLTLVPVENALKDAKLSKANIDEVLLVGGSTRIPKVQSILQEFFGGKNLNKSINPDEVVACGAAIQASLLQPDKDEMIANLSLCDVVPLSYGIETLGKLFSTIIPRNTPYPITKWNLYKTIEDHQTGVKIRVFQGERPRCYDNHYLGEFVVSNLPSRWAGEVAVKVQIEIDENGILEVSATEETSGSRNSIEIKNESGKLSEAQIEDFIAEAERMKQGDTKLKEAIEAKNKLQLIAYELRRRANEDFPRRYRIEKTRRIVRKKVDEIIQWLNNNPDATIDEIQIQYQNLQSFKSKQKL